MPRQDEDSHNSPSLDPLLQICEVKSLTLTALRPVTVFAEKVSPDLPLCFVFVATHAHAGDVFWFEL